MKKFIVTLAFIPFAMVSHAQWFIGGNVGYLSKSDKTSWSNNSRTESLSGFSFAPMIGFQSNKTMFGGNLILSSNTVAFTESWSSSSSKNETTVFFWGVQPFIRCTFWEFGKFSVFAHAGVHFLSGNKKEKSIFGNNSEFSLTSFGLSVTPVLSYSLSERIRLETSLNFMNLSWNRDTEKNKRRTQDKISSIDFGLGINSGNIINVGTISIGFIYNFKPHDAERKQFRKEDREIRRTERNEHVEEQTILKFGKRNRR